jgi:hypothetical protein
MNSYYSEEWLCDARELLHDIRQLARSCTESHTGVSDLAFLLADEFLSEEISLEGAERALAELEEMLDSQMTAEAIKTGGMEQLAA